MATLRRPAGLPPPAAAALPRAGRWWPALWLAAAVLGWHAWLVVLLAPAAPRPGAPRPGLVQLRSLPPAAGATAAAPVSIPAAQPIQRGQPTVVAAPGWRARPAAATPLADRAPAPAPATAALDPAGAVALPLAAAADAGPAPAEDDRRAGVAADDHQAGAAADAAAGEPPPLYPTRLPPPVQLRYSLHYNGQAGEARLDWQHDGAGYRLTLDGTGPAGRPLVAQASTGMLDAHGLAPERFVDRRRSGRQQAANFRRDIGRIGYSGPAWQHPAWPGAQDRLSWLAQLAAILGAAEAGGGTPAALQLFVTDAQGHAGLWQLQRQPDVPGPTPWGLQTLQHWVREPPRPEGLRIDIWLAAQPGTPAGAWPQRLRFAVPRSGDVFELQLLAAP